MNSQQGTEGCNELAHDDTVCSEMACGDIAMTRNRYFTGKFMTARDFRDEQNYFISRRQLHHRLFHGWGIVCGLEVEEHYDRRCQDRFVVVNAGVAIDCCGRELILPERTVAKIWDPPQEPSKHAQIDRAVDIPDHEQEAPPEEPECSPGMYLLVLRYGEAERECVPALDENGDYSPDRKEANRIEEIAKLVVYRWEDVQDDSGWRRAEGEPDYPCLDDCEQSSPGPVGVCLTPECPIDHMVPLALVQPHKARNKYVIKESDIDLAGRRQLLLPAQYLTKIVDTNWIHGRAMPFSKLKDELGGCLTVRFSRRLWKPSRRRVEHGSRQQEKPEQSDSPNEADAKLADTTDWGTGINEFTFRVEYGGVQQDMEILPGNVRLDPEGCLATFQIPEYYLGRWENLSQHFVHVTLKCDFILDCHRNAVDGSHMGGRLPTGNGYPGGDFESWFRVVND